MRRLALVTASLALLGAAPASAQDVPVAFTVQKTVNVRAGGVTSTALRCPTPAVALNGAAVAVGRGAIARDSQPVVNSAARWNFRFVASGSPGKRRGKAVLRCVRLRLPAGVSGARLNVMTANTGFETVAGDSSRLFTLSCDQGFAPTGWGVERRLQGAAARRLRVSRAQPTSNGWVFQLKNLGRADASGRLHIRCVQRRQTANGGQQHTFDIRRASFSEGGRRKGVSHSCRSNEFSLTTGVRLAPARDIDLDSTQPSGTRGGLWRFDLSPARNKPVKTYLLCLDRATRFG